MTASLTAFVAADRAASPAARFGRLGRVAAAGTLVVGASFQVIAFALIPDHDHTIDRLQWIADHPTQAQISKAFDLLAVPFLLGAALGILFTSAALWRFGAVRRGAAVLFVVFFIVDAPLSQQLIGHLIALVAAVWIASTILRARPAAP